MSYNPLTQNPSLAHYDVLDEVCTPLKQLGINFFGYTAVDSFNNAYCLGSRPLYALEYLKHNCAQNDVHYYHENATQKYEYLFWDYLEKDNKTEALYQMAAAFDQGHTLTISSQEEGLNHCYHFSASLANEKMNQFYLENMDLLHSFISYFKRCLKDIPELTKVYNSPVNINIEALSKYEKTTSIQADPRQIELEEVGANRLRFKNSASYYLTSREVMTLHWLRLGKTADMIALIQGVSRKTVERRIAAIKEKMRCQTLFQLGEKVAIIGLSSLLALRRQTH